MRIYVFGLLILFLACERPTPSKEYKNVMDHAEPIKMPIFQVPYEYTAKLKKYPEGAAADYYPFYIGESIDTLIISDSLHKVEIKRVEFPSGKTDFLYEVLSDLPPPPGSPFYKSEIPNELLVYVDTSSNIPKNEFIPYPNGELRSYRSHPVVLKNPTQDTVWVGYGDFLDLILEAQDSLGAWRPIQQSYVYYCGTGLQSIHLLPNQIAITGCPIFEGDFKTNLRLRFNQDFVSNEFEGYIDERQFELERRY